MPESSIQFLKRRGIIIKAGFESSRPKRAAESQVAFLNKNGVSIKGKNILIFGYGGNFGTACELLTLGAAHVTLTDLFAGQDSRRNAELEKTYATYLSHSGNKTVPKPEYISLVHGDILETAKDLSVDIVLSTSVYEHLEDMDSSTAALASCTKKGGCHLHLVDLRDHFFKDPFRMLTFSESTWRRWLNPGSHLNRNRVWDYEKSFHTYFQSVQVQVLRSNQEAFLKIKNKIKPEFLSGDLERDAITMIYILAKQPKRYKQL